MPKVKPCWPTCIATVCISKPSRPSSARSSPKSNARLDMIRLKNRRRSSDVCSSPQIHPNEIRARYEALLEVAESIASHRQLSTLFADLNTRLQRLITFDFIGLTLLDPATRIFRLHILQTDRTVVGDRAYEVPFDQAPTGEALCTRQPYYAPDVGALHLYPILETILRANSIESFCTLPLFTARRDLGGLNFGSMHKNAYSPQDIEFMQQVARQVAVAVDNALNYESARAYEEQLARERDRLRALLEINNAVVSCLSVRPLFQAISASLRRTFNLDYTSLLIYDPEARALHEL